MTERKYSVRELDALRGAVENKWMFGRYDPVGNCIGRSYMADEKTKIVEEMVRTHMMAGHTAAELIASEQPSRESVG